jgi:nicotinate-nucleotide--dimethylbenzimidazole phosphoribosyltransferase
MTASRGLVAGAPPPLDQATIADARRRLDNLTKPQGSLGLLEELVVQLAGMTGRCPPCLERRAVVIMAADHGVACEGVSAYPQAVTAQMVGNFTRGGAAVNVLARRAGASLLVVDMGVVAEVADHPLLLKRRIAAGTANLARRPAMSREQAIQSIEIGLEVALQKVDAGVDVLIGGEMGIGNTTSASAVAAVLLDADPAVVTGVGTGIDNSVLSRKVDVIRRAVAANNPDPNDATDVLAKLGGFEIGGLAGLMLGAAAKGVPVVLDGFICGAAALVAERVQPGVRERLIAGHVSSEPGHALILRELGLRPLLNLDMRLGEATGALVALGVIDSALALFGEMATFEEAGVAR